MYYAIIPVFKKFWHKEPNQMVKDLEKFLAENEEIDSVIIENDFKGIPEGLEVYMAQLRKFDVLTREEELELSTTFCNSRKELLKFSLEAPECLADLYLLPETINLRTLMGNHVEKGDSKERINDLKTQYLEFLVQKNSSEKMTFIEGMEISFDFLSKITKLIESPEKKQRISTLSTQAIVAKQKLIHHNLRLVYSLAQKFLNRGLSLEDLIQEGNMGLIRAIDKFEPSRGLKLSTYATFWIKQSCGRAIADKSREIRVPVYLDEKLTKLSKEESNLTKKLGRSPSLNEVAKHTDMDSKKVKKLWATKMTPKSLYDVISHNDGDDSGRAFLEMLPDTNALDPLDHYLEKELNTKIRKFLSKLTPQQEKVIRMRFGIGEAPLVFSGQVRHKTAEVRYQTLEEVGQELNLSRERIRQIEVQGLVKIKKWWKFSQDT